MNKKRLFLSLEGVDINDDEVLAAFTQQVWEQATTEFDRSADRDASESDTASE